MTELPRKAVARTAKLASLPLGVAGRAAAGWGRRLAGGDGDEISAQLMAKSAEQLFAGRRYTEARRAYADLCHRLHDRPGE